MSSPVLTFSSSAPFVDFARREALGFLHVVAPVLHQLDLAAFGRAAEREIDAAHRGEDVGQDAMALRIAGDVVEQHRRIAGLALEDVDDAADLALALGARDVRHLAGRLHLGEPDPQVLPRRIGAAGGARIDVGVHGAFLGSRHICSSLLSICRLRSLFVAPAESGGAITFTHPGVWPSPPSRPDDSDERRCKFRKRPRPHPSLRIPAAINPAVREHPLVLGHQQFDRVPARSRPILFERVTRSANRATNASFIPPSSSL